MGGWCGCHVEFGGDVGLVCPVRTFLLRAVLWHRPFRTLASWPSCLWPCSPCPCSLLSFPSDRHLSTGYWGHGCGGGSGSCSHGCVTGCCWSTNNLNGMAANRHRTCALRQFSCSPCLFEHGYFDSQSCKCDGLGDPRGGKPCRHKGLIGPAIQAMQTCQRFPPRPECMTWVVPLWGLMQLVQALSLAPGLWQIVLPSWPFCPTPKSVMGWFPNRSPLQVWSWPTRTRIKPMQHLHCSCLWLLPGPSQDQPRYHHMGHCH